MEKKELANKLLSKPIAQTNQIQNEKAMPTIEYPGKKIWFCSTHLFCSMFFYFVRSIDQCHWHWCSSTSNQALIRVFRTNSHDLHIILLRILLTADWNHGIRRSFWSLLSTSNTNFKFSVSLILFIWILIEKATIITVAHKFTRLC